MIKVAGYVEMLVSNLTIALPYFYTSPLDVGWEKCERNSFPSEPGIYAILRRCAIAKEGYRYQGLNPINPIVLYVGKASSVRTIGRRLRDHFGNREPNFQGSQFVKFLMQVVQDEEMVKRLLWSPSTIIACVPVTESDAVISAVERLAIQILEPRFNIKDR
jgi:excinuclease UvrABC nuclease subunit